MAETADNSEAVPTGTTVSTTPPYEVLSFDIVNGKAIIMVRAANGSLWAGYVKGFVQLSNGRI